MIASPVINEIAAERVRQVTEEGYSPEVDDAHFRGEIAAAAACYAAPFRVFREERRAGRAYEPFVTFTDAWPWGDDWWKPRSRRRDLIRAAALIVAEIERIDRAANKEALTMGAVKNHFHDEICALPEPGEPQGEIPVHMGVNATTVCAEIAALEQQNTILGEKIQAAEGATRELRDALEMLVADFADYPASERPCHAFDVARDLLAKARGAASEKKFTPGSYTLCDRGDYSDFNGNSRVILGEDIIGIPFRLAVVHTDGSDEAEANAFLFAAASKLYAAAERAAQVLGQLADSKPVTDAYTALTAALAKARGEA